MPFALTHSLLIVSGFGVLLGGELTPRLAAQAKYGVHPHIAPIANPPAGGAWIRAGSLPLFNQPDDIWNNGEGFPKDTGGMFGFDDGSGMTLGDIKTWLAWHLWTPPQGGTNYQRFVGYLEGDVSGATGPMDPEAAFELIAPANYDRTKDVVIAIGCFATMPGGPTAGQEVFEYPGTSQTDWLYRDLSGGGSNPLRPFKPWQMVDGGNGKPYHVIAQVSCPIPANAPVGLTVLFQALSYDDVSQSFALSGPTAAVVGW